MFTSHLELLTFLQYYIANCVLYRNIKVFLGQKQPLHFLQQSPSKLVNYQCAANLTGNAKLLRPLRVSLLSCNGSLCKFILRSPLR